MAPPHPPQSAGLGMSVPSPPTLPRDESLVSYWEVTSSLLVFIMLEPDFGNFHSLAPRIESRTVERMTYLCRCSFRR